MDGAAQSGRYGIERMGVDAEEFGRNFGCHFG